ncbi:MAG: hypothetical protein JWO23_702 [Solirubrobacterales bacterium]|nr:hypothetical protein [Solirubrobacterales bacterium]
MTTRTILTSQPDVACDVCERRLLRGEQADVFLATGRRRVVCELCTPRAVHEGWLRESDDQSLSLPPLRPRRGRSLLDRLPVPFRARQPAEAGTDADEQPRSRLRYERRSEAAAEPEPYDFLDADADADATAAPARAGRRGEGLGSAPDGSLERSEPPSALDRALEAFNASEHPRRVAGVARSLGAPEVNVRSAEHAASVIRIMVAWELCWYRYEVDLDEPEAGARVAAQGTELAELTHEDRLVNAVADDGGSLSLAGA